MPVLNFLRYNNAVPIVISLVLLSGGAAFAAGNPEAIYSATDKVISVDNSYIATADLSTYTPKVTITAVNENTDSYFVSYDFSTIDVDSYRWQQIVKHNTLEVPKTALLEIDLGHYATAQLQQLVDQEGRRLVEAQEMARKQQSALVVSTTYGGLVGTLLDSSTHTEPSYTPPPPSSPGETASTPNTSVPISITILGNNPAHVPLRAQYNDLGAVVEPVSLNIGYKTYMDDKEVPTINIDTSTSSTYTVEYRAVNQAGTEARATRTIIVE